MHAEGWFSRSVYLFSHPLFLHVRMVSIPTGSAGSSSSTTLDDARVVTV
jgi:hypothetical protein